MGAVAAQRVTALRPKVVAQQYVAQAPLALQTAIPIARAPHFAVLTLPPTPTASQAAAQI